MPSKNGKIYSKRYYEKHKEEIAEKQKNSLYKYQEKYYIENKEIIKEKAKIGFTI